MLQPARSPRTPFVAFALTLSVGVIGVPTPAAAAHPPAPRLEAKMDLEAPPEQPPRVALRVDTEALGSGADEPMKKKIVEVATAEFGERGFAEALDDQDPTIVVVVERIGDEENPGFAIGYSIETKGGKVVPGSARQTDCSLCTRTEVIERIEKDLGPLLDLALEHQAERPVEGGDGDGDGPVEPVVEDERKIGPLGFAGIGVAVVGLGGVGAGVGLAIKGVEPFPPYDQAKDFRTPGLVVLGIGGAALVAGVVMIALDVSKRKKARTSKAAKIQPMGLGIAF